MITVTANGGLPPRTAAKSLIWAANGVTFRLEMALPFDQALLIAESLR